MSQPSLFDGIAPEFAAPEPKPTIAQRAADFHRLNGWVYDALATLARQWKARGAQHLAIALLFEQLRAEWELATVDPSAPYRLNNSYRSFYARWLMAREPDLAGLFSTRELRSVA